MTPLIYFHVLLNIVSICHKYTLEEDYYNFRPWNEVVMLEEYPYDLLGDIILGSQTLRPIKFQRVRQYTEDDWSGLLFILVERIKYLLVLVLVIELGNRSLRQLCNMRWPSDMHI